jgi:hypothetical protein
VPGGQFEENRAGARNGRLFSKPAISGYTQLERCYEATTCFGAENSEVSPVEVFVAVAVTFCFRAMYLNVEKVKETWPEPSVVTVLEPRYLLPSFVPFALEKNCTLKDSS